MRVFVSAAIYCLGTRRSSAFRPGDRQAAELSGPMAMACDRLFITTPRAIGKHVTNRYLGLAMRIDGEIHYGWARLSTSGVLNFQAVLTGYAYETEAGKSIVAGDEGTSAPGYRIGRISKVEPIQTGRTLGELALGFARPSH